MVVITAVNRSRSVWDLSSRQHGVVARPQLVDLGLTDSAINCRLHNGRLHRLHRGVYAVGRPQVDRRGFWLAAVLACGPRAALSHRSAGELWGLLRRGETPAEVSVPLDVHRRRPGIVIRRRSRLEADDVTEREGIQLTTPSRTLIDLAAVLPTRRLEAAINEADKLNLIDLEELRGKVERQGSMHGARTLRELLDLRFFALSDSELERRFMPLARRAGLEKPLTQAMVAGHRADFYWPTLGLVVETDGLRYHRTPIQQAKDRERDQAYATAGLTPLRFTHAQVATDPERVIGVLRAVVARLGPS
jgi:very-short-patch-repair endonuclease